MTQVQITTWAPEGTTPTLESGRWVQLGKPTLINYWLTGLPGGKVYLNAAWPYVRFERNRTKFINFITAQVDSSLLVRPTGVGPDGMVKALFGQRRIDRTV